MVANLLNPTCLVVGGDMAQAGDMLLDAIRVGLRRHALGSLGATVELRTAVLPDHLETYDRMRRRGGLVVVRVRGHNCGACGVELPDRVLEQARDDNLMPTCDNCGRVLQGE